MSNEVYLGGPPQYVLDWLLNDRSPTGDWFKIVKALEKGDIKDGTLNGVDFDGNDVTLGSILVTPIAYYQGDDGTIVDRSEWIVCGFNGAVPEHVKYIMNGTRRVFVKATDDDNVERPIAVGDVVYSREWNNVSNSYDYSRIGVVATTSDEMFTYGTTSTDYGTIAISEQYSVPMNLTIKLDGKESVSMARFAGQNMQVWSNHTYLDADAAGSYEAAKAMMTDDKQFTSMPFGASKLWKDSYVRGFLNGTSKPNGYIWSDSSVWGARTSYTVKHNFIEKLALNTDDLLPSVCKQVNRNWESSGNVVRTIDAFWLPGCDYLKSATTVTSIVTEDEFKDSVEGMTEEREYNAHMYIKSINGCSGLFDGHYCWLRSAGSSVITVATLYGEHLGYTGYANDYTGFAPAFSIG